MIAFLLLAILPQQSDWLSTVSVPADPPAAAEADWISTVDSGKAKCDCEDCNCAKLTGEVNTLSTLAMAHEQEIQELKAAVEELRQRALTTKAAAPVDLSGILREIAELKARPAFTESEIRAFAKEEIEKFHAEVRLKDGTVKKVEATDVSVTVQGFSGTFEVPPGGVVTSINGVPVNSNNGWVRTVNPVTRQTTSMVGQTPSFNVRAVPQRNNVRFFALPRRTANGDVYPHWSSAAPGTCQIVNGVKVCN